MQYTNACNITLHTTHACNACTHTRMHTYYAYINACTHIHTHTHRILTKASGSRRLTYISSFLFFSLQCKGATQHKSVRAADTTHEKHTMDLIHYLRFSIQITVTRDSKGMGNGYYVHYCNHILGYYHLSPVSVLGTLEVNFGDY